MTYPDQDMTKKYTVTFPDVYSVGSTVDENTAAAQKVLKVAATGNFHATDGNKGWRVIINRGGDREEEGTVDTIQAGVSITLDANLVYAHTAAQADVVEVLWAGISTVIVKKHHKKLCLFLPSTWVTAKITFAGCITLNGTYIEVVKGTDVAELEVAEVAASLCIGLDGILMEALENIPYIKLRSGVEGTEVDQYSDAVIYYVLMR